MSASQTHAEFATLRHLLDRLEEVYLALGQERAVREAVSTELERVRSVRQVNGADVVALFDALASGSKIEAIKYYRALTGHGLKESKDAVERVQSALAVRAEQPAA